MSTNRGSIWPGADERLTALWLDGMKTAAIARVLGVSKSAVVGRAHRIDLPERPSPIIRRDPNAPRATAPRVHRAKRPTLPPLSTPAPPAPPPPVVWIRPRGKCQWPTDEPGSKGFRFCDDSTEPGKSYCEDHCKLAYVRVRDRREDAA